jgi:hypothetical protein
MAKIRHAFMAFKHTLSKNHIIKVIVNRPAITWRKPLHMTVIKMRILAVLLVFLVFQTQ